ncbi:Coenzyme F420 hydrogenase/dehydrogenase, beta subunit C-terminal domain [Sneathiella limimaris]|uniref:Coenzyme F420 hydrogenase/dehydrogenase, beta subunit C-terminal domain n=1 Tax=Sneathiella limimaris TaxID=1964213 RepID=UPI00146B2E95|nr:Coenzyme F420 hydrogenase/dehydrogenase, beta subunit C-terminal domain [Sneathiella limimaris]
MVNKLNRKLSVSGIRSIEDVVEKHLCTGCGACEYAEPKRYEMRETLEHCNRPFLRDKPAVETGRGLAACPGFFLEHEETHSNENLLKELFPAWGPVIAVYEGYSLDEEIRFKSSSGGAATALSLFALQNNEVEGVLHVGPVENAPYLNETKYSTDRAGLIKNSGSRYAPSSPCDGLGELVARQKKSVFVGKPCDVAAVHKLKRTDTSLDSKLEVTISFFCAGTPSTKGVTKLLNREKVNPLSSLSSLKYRGFGWPGLWVADFRDKKGALNSASLTYKESWGFLQKYRQWRCYICPDHTGEFADISVGDPWYREPTEGEIGKSLIVVRTEKGKRFLEAAVAEGFIYLENSDASLLPRSQPNLIKARGMLWGRLLALRLAGASVPKYKGFGMARYWLRELTFRERLSSILGTIKRVYAKGLRKRLRIEQL